ncbi:MAG TPA: translocation/assembly module TamB domain-containing protein [Planctomycetota bacterium]
MHEDPISLNDTAARPARRRPRRFVRRALRVLLWCLLVLAALLLLLWSFRESLLAPLLRPRLEAELATTLGAQRVSIGALGGDWFGAIDVKDVVVEGAAPPLREVRGLRLEARYSLPDLLAGDLTGLHAVAVTAAEVELDLRPQAGGQGSPEPAQPFDPRACARWLRLLPEGARVHVDRLRVAAPHGERLGPLDATLPAGAGGRRLAVSYAGLRAELRSAAPGAAADAVALEVTCDAADPGALLDLFGLGGGVRGGTMHAELGLRLEPLLLEARIDLADLVHGDERLAKSRVIARLDRKTLAIERASLDLPGVAVELQELALPSPFVTRGVDVRELAGRFAVRFDDLSPHAALLPQAVQELLPIRGHLAGSATRGMLRLDASELQTRGARLRIESGAVPLASDDWRAARGSVRCSLLLDAFATRLPGLGAATASGRVDATVEGSVSEPRLEVRLDLGECRSEPCSFASAHGFVHADATGAVIEALRVQQLTAAALGSQAPTNVVLDASCALRAGRIDTDSLVAKLELVSLVPSDLLAPIFAVQGLGPPPEGMTTLQLHARHDRRGIAVDSLHVRSAPGSPFEVAIDGEGTLPLHWSGTGAPAVLAAGALVLRVSASRAELRPEVPPIDFEGTLRLDSGSARLGELGLAFGPARLRGELTASYGLASLLDPAADVAMAPLQLAIDLEQFDLARLPSIGATPWLGGARLQGLVAGRVRVTGTARQPQPDVLLTLAGGAVAGEGLPALTGAQLRLEVTAGDPAAEEILVAASASATLDEALGLDRQLAFEARARCGERGTTLDPSVLKIGGGELTLELASNLRRSDLLAGALDRTSLAGTVRLREFALEKLPRQLLGVDSLHGIVSGELTLDGAPGAPFGLQTLHEARLSLRDGELKAAAVPRIEHLAAELTADRHEIVLRSLTGVLGAGRFSAKGSLRQTGQRLVDAFDDAALELQLDGEEVLLHRAEGAKVRANVHTTVSGTPRALAVRGDVLLGRGTKYVRRISMLPDLAAHQGAAASVGLQLGGMPPALGDRIDLDVSLKTREPVEVRTNLVDGDIDVAARLRGTGTAPRLEGTMAMRRGTLRFPGANLAVDSALLTFTRSNPLFPEIVVNATGRRMGIVVSMSVAGRYDRPQIHLSSVPTLPPQDLIVLLTTGQLPSTIVERGPVGQARFVGGYLAQEVFEKYFGSESTERGPSLFDRLTIETGREISKNGTESVVIEYELVPRFSVQVERDAYEDYNLGLVLRFRFR